MKDRTVHLWGRSLVICIFGGLALTGASSYIDNNLGSLMGHVGLVLCVGGLFTMMLLVAWDVTS